MMGKRVGMAMVVGALALWGTSGCRKDSTGDRNGGVKGSPGDSAGSSGGAGADGSGSAGGTGATSRSPSPLSAPADSIPPGALCELSGWCWYNPRPSGDEWTTVTGAGRSDLWVAGQSPQALHFDGGHWTLVGNPLLLTLGSWAASKNDVWFAGATTGDGMTAGIAHWDGTSMTLVPGLPTVTELTGIWGSGPNDIYAIGYQSAIHWDGTAWTIIPGVMGTTISASGPNDIWVGNYDGMYHYDGTSWTRPPQFLGVSVQSVSVVAPNDLWVLESGTGFYSVEHFDGTNRTPSGLQVPSNGMTVFGLEATSDHDVWVVGGDFTVPHSEARGYLSHFDGSAWTQAPLAPTIMESVANTPGLGTVAVGFDGGLLRLTAAPQPGFTDLRSGPAEDLLGTFGTSAADMWAVGNGGTILHFDGHTVANVAAGVTADLTDVWGTSPSDVWAVGLGGTVLHFDGHAFAPVASGTSVNLTAVFTARPNDVWIGGDANTLLHWDGSSMSKVALPGAATDGTIFDIHGIGPDDIWLTSGNGSVGPFMAHFDGTSWSSTLVGGPTLRRVWALAPNDVWATAGVIGSGGLLGLAHFDGTSWTLLTGHASDVPTYVFPNEDGGSFVFGPHDRWIVGRMGLWQRSTM